MVTISEVAKQSQLERWEIQACCVNLKIKSKRIGRHNYITNEQKDEVFRNLYFILKMEFILLESKMNYD